MRMRPKCSNRELTSRKQLNTILLIKGFVLESKVYRSLQSYRRTPTFIRTPFMSRNTSLVLSLFFQNFPVEHLNYAQQFYFYRNPVLTRYCMADRNAVIPHTPICGEAAVLRLEKRCEHSMDRLDEK